MSEYFNIQTPFARSAYVHINAEDPKYGKYKVTLFFAPKDAARITDAIEEVITENFTPKDAKGIKRPYETDPETGELKVQFNSNKQPKVFDASGNLIPAASLPRIYGGSVLRVNGAFKANQNTSPKSVSRFMNEIQIKTLSQGGAGGGGFGATEGGYTFEKETEESNTGFDNASDETGSNNPLDI